MGMKAFVTGGTGFIGLRLVRRLVARGDEVYALARSAESAARLTELGARVVRGDVTDKVSMRAGMQGCDVVYHLAAWYEIGTRNQTRMALVNVEGTRNVLELAYELGIPKIIHTSSLIVFGNTEGRLVDESFYKAGPFASVYHRTKWQAHYEIAVPLIEKGAPLVIVMPGAVYGPGDRSLVGLIMRWFYRGCLPVLPGSNMMLSYVHADDVARGIILAADKGQIGESYILAGPSLTLREAVTLWADITGRRAPRIGIPGQVFSPLAPVLGALMRVVRLPEWLSEEVVRVLGMTYIARADKAYEHLGWHPRPLPEGLRETFEWIAETTPPPDQTRRKRALVALVVVCVVFLIWLTRRSKSRQ